MPRTLTIAAAIFLSACTSAYDADGTVIIQREESNLLPSYDYVPPPHGAFVELKQLKDGDYFILSTIESFHGCTRRIDPAIGRRISAAVVRGKSRYDEINDPKAQMSDYWIQYWSDLPPSAEPAKADANIVRNHLWDLTTALSNYCRGLSSADEKRVVDAIAQMEDD
jgi:hypothetical protein